MRPRGQDALATILIAQNDGISLFAGMDQAGDLHLLIPVRSESAFLHPGDLNGLKVRHHMIGDVGHVLDLCAPASHEQVFTPFCVEIAHAILEEARDPWKAVSATVRAWQSAWKPLRPQMEKTVQVGLFGELLVLRTLIWPCINSAAIDQWSGPQSERHDFVGEALHIEVKTTRKSRSEHEISRLDQLHCPSGCELLLVSVQLEESVGGNETLASQVDAIVALLRPHPASLDDFMAKMASMGWSEEMRTSGELLRFFVRRVEIYAVDDCFPRLSENFQLPHGIVSLKYTIDLANLPMLGLDEVRAKLRSANPQYALY